MKIGRIYGLRDPRTGKTHYVGETINELDGRLGGHIVAILDCKRRKSHNAEYIAWMRDLLSSDMIPQIYLLEEIQQIGDLKLDKRARWEREQLWVQKLREAGELILNRKCGVQKGFKRGTSKLKGRPLSFEHLQKHKERLRKQYREDPDKAIKHLRDGIKKFWDSLTPEQRSERAKRQAEARKLKKIKNARYAHHSDVSRASKAKAE